MLWLSKYTVSLLLSTVYQHSDTDSLFEPILEPILEPTWKLKPEVNKI